MAENTGEPKKAEKKTGGGGINNLVPFQKGHKTRSTSEQKKAGRERKKQAARMMDCMLKYQNMTKAELEEHSRDKNLSVLELLMIKYVISGMKDNKMLIDMIDRHISKAPQIVENTGENGADLFKKVVFNIVTPK